MSEEILTYLEARPKSEAELAQSSRALSRASSVLARANNRTIKLAVSGKRRGSQTVGGSGQTILTTAGMSGGWTSSTMIESDGVIWPEASGVTVLTGIPLHTVGSQARWELQLLAGH